VSGARGARLRGAARAGATVAVALVLAVAGGCGKKAPLRLPDQRPAERAATPRLSVREGQITLDFSVPAHRVFPEREDPWVLARVLRRDAPAREFLEVGTVLQRDGFAFEAPVSWSEAARIAGASAYRVEFRDAARRRRALSDPVEIAWQPPPGSPMELTASADDHAVALAWGAPAGAAAGTRYRVYRRDPPDGKPERLTPEPLEGPRYIDSRVRPAREYCYRVRAVLAAPAAELEGPPGAELCVRTDDVTPPPPPDALHVTAAPGSFQLTWTAVTVPDLLGYRVYRSIGDGPFELLTPTPVRGNAWREDARDARAGARYRYVVTAVDNSARANESPFSPAAEAPAVPAPGAP
jgi:predicted small lipoprotein YifL